MNEAKSTPPAIVLGVGITALGVMRCLARSGVKTYCADEKIDFVRHSRYYAKPPGSELLGSTDQLSQFLRRLNLDQAVLMPAGDQWSRAIYGIEPDLKPRFFASAPSFDIWNTLTDKGLLAKFLTTHDIPHPRSLEIDSGANLNNAQSLFPGKWFIKPRDSEQFFRKYWVKAFEVANLEELKKRAEQLFGDGLGFILQEYIQGPPSNHIFVDGFIDRDGEVRGLLARQRLRMFPRLFGNSSYMVTIDKSQASREIELILSALRAASYRGIFSVEFKRDERDSIPRLLEINTRPWWYIWFAERCGVSFAQMAYRDALERDVETCDTYSVGTYMVYPLNDLYACREAVRNGKLTYAGWLGEWFKAKQAVFWIGDPLPSLIWFIREIWRYCGRRLARRRGKSRANRTKATTGA